MARSMPKQEVGVTRARPFLKWVGGKAQLLPEILKHAPATFGAYHEPFVGAGALFFALQPRVAWLGDANAELISTYRVIRSHSAQLILCMRANYAGANNEADFYRIRAEAWATDVEIAARMIYLNKTCFNGLYRVNKAGRFNAPYGRYPKPTICDEDNLLACSDALKGANVHREDFTEVERRAVPGDFVYFDPPYVPLTKTSNFDAYTAGGFGMERQTELRDLAIRLKDRGVHVLLSNSASPAVEDLYGKDFALTPVAARRSVNSKGAGRGAIAEYLIQGAA
jgi:DNA adenine methylase